MVAGVGGPLGLAVAAGVATTLRKSQLDWALPATLDVRLDVRVALFALAASTGAGLGFGLLPALRATSLGVAPSLRDDAAATIGARRRLGLTGLLVAEYLGRTDVAGGTYRSESGPDRPVEIVGVVGDVTVRARRATHAGPLLDRNGGIVRGLGHAPERARGLAPTLALLGPRLHGEPRNPAGDGRSRRPLGAHRARGDGPPRDAGGPRRSDPGAAAGLAFLNRRARAAPESR